MNSARKRKNPSITGNKKKNKGKIMEKKMVFEPPTPEEPKDVAFLYQSKKKI
jgi:hypothetical protein